MTVPDILYKYTTAETAQIVLETGRLRWQSPCQFNDVSELQIMPKLVPDFVAAAPLYKTKLVDIAYTNEPIDMSIYSESTQAILRLLAVAKNQGDSREDVLAKLETIGAKNNQDLDATLRLNTGNHNDGSLRFFCLTENECNALMWAHYGESSKGCMLGFQHISELQTPFLEAEKVNYTDDAPVIASALDIYLYGATKNNNADTRRTIYFTKAECWKYEKEWRVMIKREGGKQKFSDFKFYPEELKSVTFGLNMDKDIKMKILELITSKYPHCELYEIERNSGVLSRVRNKG